MLIHCKKCWNKFDTSNHKVKRLLPQRKNKELIGLMKNRLGGEKSWQPLFDQNQKYIII